MRTTWEPDWAWAVWTALSVGIITGAAWDSLDALIAGAFAGGWAFLTMNMAEHYLHERRMRKAMRQ